MEITIHEITQGNLFWLLIFTLTGYVILRIIKKYLPLMMKKELSKRIIGIGIPILEVLFWLWVFYESIPVFYNHHKLLGILVFTIALSAIIWYTWYRLRDYVAAFIFRTGNEISIGESIEYENVSGKVISFKSRYIELKNASGDIELIPYTAISGKRIIRHQNTEQSQSFKFAISINGETPPKTQAADIKQFILRQPWSSLSKDPVIRYLGNDDEGNHYEITVFTPDNSYAEKIKRELQKRFK